MNKGLNVVGLKNFILNKSNNNNNYNNNKITISKPIEINRYSYDSIDNNYTPLLNKFKLPNIGSNLLDGFKDSTSVLNDVDSPLTFILNKLMEVNYNVTNTNFISYRNSFRKIFESYNDKNSWSINIQRLHNTIHFGMDNKKDDFNNNNNSIHLKSMYSGNKFEEISKYEDNEIDKKYCSIIHSKLFINNFILAAEIDCYEKHGKQITDKLYTIDDYVELKTTREITNEKSDYFFKSSKLFKIWFQSYIAGVSKLYIGVRDDNFRLKQVIKYNTQDIPRLGINWNKNDVLAYGNGILEFIKDNTLPNKSYKLEFQYPDLLLIESPSIFILSDQYIQYFNNLLNNKETTVTTTSTTTTTITGEKRNFEKDCNREQEEKKEENEEDEDRLLKKLKN